MTSSPTALASSAFPSTLPPVRQLRQMPLPLMASVSEDPISLWLKLGALEKLEQVVLDGHGDQLHGKSSRIPQVNKFLRQVPAFQSKIDEIHRAVAQGKLRKIQHLIDRKKLAFCRDQMGASSLHKAVMFRQKEVIGYLTSHYGSIIHTRDHQGRTPLHYAAVLQDDGEIYNFLLEAGADKKATDMHGHTAEHYLKSQDELTLQDLKQGAKKKIVRKGKHRNIKGAESGHSKLHNKNKQLIHELVLKGNLESLENLVLKGQGDKLLDESSSNPLVVDFLNMVPVYMERIQAIHRSVVKGRLRDVQSLLDRKSLALAKDATGATPLHKAVMYGHQDIAKYIAQNFPLSRDVKDTEGYTALHYAAVLKDGQEMYNMLIGAGARTSILDSKEKLPEYYLEHADEINLNQIIKRNQRLNASYASKTANKLKKRLQPKGPLQPVSKINDSPKNLGENQEALEDNYEGMENGTSGVEGHSPLYKRGILLRDKPLMPASQLKRDEVTSANIRKWITEEDIEKLEGAIIEGYGEKILEQDVNKEDIQNYLSSSVPEMLAKIKAIHTAVSNDDLLELQGHLDKNDLALAKDHSGMTPLHRAVLLGRMNVLQFLVDKFPETINAKDKEGRTALHYAAAVVRRSGGKSYGFLLEAGGDIRARDNQGHTAEYYLNHNVAIPNLSEMKVRPTQKKNKPDVSLAAHNRVTVVAASGMSERITNCLQKGDLEQLKEIVLEGKGKHLVGRTSWNEETRQFLRALPSNLARIDSLHNAVRAGDVEAAKSLLNEDIMMIRARDEFGNTPVHLSIIKNQPEMLQYLINNFPTVLNLKDKNGRTALHRAAQEKNEELYKILIEAGADPMILDQKGRTAEYYMHGPVRYEPSTKPSTEVSESDSGTENQSSFDNEETELVVDEAVVGNDVDTSAVQKDSSVDTSVSQKELSNSQKDEKELSNNHKDEKEEPLSDKMSEQKDISNKIAEEEKEQENKDEDSQSLMETEHTKEKESSDSSTKKEDESNDADSISTPSMATSTGKASTWDRLNELIDYWIRERDLLRLEHVVIAGQGQRLIGRTSDDKQVQEFLDLVPTYMARISSVHEAVVRGNLAEVKAVLTRKRFALSRDHLGASPLHLAVLHGHTDILRYIINHFPETLDGPDNEGRTPLHYAAIMRDGGHYYKILKNALADEEIIDKSGHTAEYYLRHPGEVTVRDLLEGYKINIDNTTKPSTVNIWQRPPTDEIEKRLTPPSSGKVTETKIDNDIKDIPKQQPEASTSAKTSKDHSDQIDKAIHPQQNEKMTKDYQNKETDDKTILFDRKTEDGKYLATALGDVLVRALTEVSQKRPPDPIGYLAAWLYNYASRTPRARLKSPVTGSHGETPSESNSAEFGEERSSSGFRTTPLDVLNTVAGNDVYNDSPLEIENHTKMKDEEGQTVLHFAASRRHPNGSFYVLISQAELLLAERDSKYRTARDVAVESGMADNVATLDRYILDAFLSQKSTLLQMLVHDGYDYLINVTDADGRDITSTLRRQEGSEAIVALVQELSDFQKNREELHTFVRHDYMEGITKLIKKDHSLVSSKNDRGRCSLHIAVVFGNTELIKALVDANNSSVHVPDNLGRTPLHYAMAMPNIEQVGKILIKAGAQRTARDVKMRTPSYFFIYKDEILSIQEEEKQLI